MYKISGKLVPRLKMPGHVGRPGLDRPQLLAVEGQCMQAALFREDVESLETLDDPKAEEPVLVLLTRAVQRIGLESLALGRDALDLVTGRVRHVEVAACARLNVAGRRIHRVVRLSGEIAIRRDFPERGSPQAH